LSLLCATAACGTLDNAPLEMGEVQGTVANADPHWQQVADVGSGLTAAFSSTGTFVLSDVPVGAAELFVVGGQHSAIRVTASINGGEVTVLGVVTPAAAGTVTVHLKSSKIQDPQHATVDVHDTPYQDEPMDMTGVAHVGPLPDGCYTALVSHPTDGSNAFDFCMSQGQDQDVDAT
jgi:hypothetical protein